MMKRYVTYNADGTLDGCYLQTPPEDHVGRMIVIDEEAAANWVNYRANEARDGVELVPPVVPVDPVPVVPSTVTRRQARQALLLDGRLDAVPVAIAALDDGTADGKQKMRMAQIEWEDSLEFERARPLVIEIAGAIGLDAAALDQLFITAAGL
jgi:hypothetical protein